MAYYSALHGTHLRMERELHNTLIVKPFPSGSASLSTTDIYTAIQNASDKTIFIGSITTFPPDFIVELPNRFLRDKILSMNPITYQDQTLTIIPWSNSYRAETTSWTLPVSIKILGIPPHALSEEYLLPVVAPFCDVHHSYFNQISGVSIVFGYAKDLESIPTSHQLPVPYRRSNYTEIHTFNLTLKALALSLYMSENNWYCVLTNEAQEHYSPGINPFSKLTIRELVHLTNGYHLQLKREHTEDNLEDPDVVRESFEHNARAEEELEEGVETNNNLEQEQTSSESNGTDPNNDYYTIDSDREPAEWKHRD